MNKQLTAEAIRELMQRYDEYRAQAIAKLGKAFDRRAFDAWFTMQATGGAA